MPMDVLHDMEKVILDDRGWIAGLDGTRIGQPEINIKDRDPQAKNPKPAQDRLNMPSIALFQSDREEEPSVFIAYRQFPTFRARGRILVEMQRGYLFF